MGLTIKVINKAGANPGDYVSVGFVPGAVLKSVAVVLGIPLLGLMSGVVVANALVQYVLLSSTGAVVAGSACFALAVLVAVVFYRRIWAGIQPFTEKIISTGLGAASLLRTIDPVCKMQVDPQKVDAKMDYKGKTYYFCNIGCLKAFTKDPEKYLAHLSCAHC
jgi:Cu+-exporting ATPase